jgi:hypothetical protein
MCIFPIFPSLGSYCYVPFFWRPDFPCYHHFHVFMPSSSFISVS